MTVDERCHAKTQTTAFSRDQTLQELASNRIECFHYDKSEAQLEILFLDTSTMSGNDLHEGWNRKMALFGFIYADENSFFPDWYPKYEMDDHRPLKRTIDMRCILKIAKNCPTRYGPCILCAEKRIYQITYLGFATVPSTEQFMNVFHFNTEKLCAVSVCLKITDCIKESLVVQFDHIFSPTGTLHRLMHLGLLPDLKGNHVNFKGAIS
ncbi:hypothetical protein EDD85DRAFT_990191 [Armillaria nabsnona]|nr:hypothetical protein EDD85DRAFT_990191 [Armillaria nabsnona]